MKADYPVAWLHSQVKNSGNKRGFQIAASVWEFTEMLLLDTRNQLVNEICVTMIHSIVEFT